MLSKTEETRLSRLTNKYIRELFDEYDVSKELRAELVGFYNEKLSKALSIGYNPKVKFYDADLAKRLRNNITQFSAFKETSFKKSLHEILTGSNKLMPWSEFKKQAEKVSGNYNKKWLKTEYDHTVANANTVAQWGKYEAQKDIYPNLQFYTVGDGAVRDDHAALEGFTAPVDDPAWNQLTTPLDWGCRCGIKQTDAKATEEKPKFKPKKQFANNPAKSGEVFKKGAPYSEHLTSAEKNEARKMADFVNKEIKTTAQLNSYMDSYAQANPHLFTNGFKKLKATSRRGVNGFTDMNGTIALKTDILNDVKKGISNINKGVATTFEQEKALSTLHHEIMHNAHKLKNVRCTRLETQFMETANEFVARKRLPRFMQSLGGKLNNVELVSNRTNTAYNSYVRNYEAIIKKCNADPNKVLVSVEKTLLNTPYNKQGLGLLDAIVEHGTLSRSQGLRLLPQMIRLSEERFLEVIKDI